MDGFAKVYIVIAHLLSLILMSVCFFETFDGRAGRFESYWSDQLLMPLAVIWCLTLYLLIKFSNPKEQEKEPVED
jgi:hypothetical protein